MGTGPFETSDRDLTRRRAAEVDDRRGRLGAISHPRESRRMATEIEDDTLDDHGSELFEGPPGRLRARIWWLTGPLLGLSLLAFVVLLIWPAPYTTESPGGTYDTRTLIEVQKGTPTFNHPGEIRFVTVSELSRPSFFQVLVGWLQSNVDVFPTKLTSEGRTRAEDQRYSAVLMSNSKQSAAFQALTRLGFGPQEMADGVFINQIVKGSSADGHLEAGDTIHALTNGGGVTTNISTTQDLAAYIKLTKPGQRLTVTVDRPGVSLKKNVNITLGSQKVDGKKVSYMGIYMETRPRYVLPFTVNFDTGDVGGPSAGLALTLSLMDKLSKTDLTNGQTVAVTGTMHVDGSVGPIGGIRQKTASVIASGATYFLVPADNYDDARAVAGKRLKVLKVTSLDDALAALKTIPKVKKTR